MSLTTYVILRAQPLRAPEVGSIPLVGWEELGKQDGSSGPLAVRAFVNSQEKPQGGTYKAVPVTNFKDVEIEVSATPVVTVKGAPAA